MALTIPTQSQKNNYSTDPPKCRVYGVAMPKLITFYFSADINELEGQLNQIASPVVSLSNNET